MSEELEVLQIVTHRLTLVQIPYMVKGSMAMNFYAMPRMTRDIDFVVELSEPDIDRMIEQFHQDFYIERDMIQQALQQQTMFNLIHMPTVIKVDCVIRKDTPYRREEFSRRQSVNIEGYPLTIVAPEDLILSKLEWAKETRSEVQMGDVRNLLRTVARLDQDYLKQWASVLGVQTMLQELNQ
jgi:predicted nucleotidyltransferase